MKHSSEKVVLDLIFGDQQLSRKMKEIQLALTTRCRMDLSGF